MSEGKCYSNIILAGDVKQLDAVTKSNVAVKMGFSTSFMENLFNERYESKDQSHHNPVHIVQLVQNYRSHPQLLCIPNQLFYGGKLVSKASEGEQRKECFSL